MRTMPMGEELLKYCNEDFADYDFLYMLFNVVLIMFMIMSTFKVVAPGDPMTETNLTLYLTVVCLVLLG